jgi:hypothetical protein
MRTSDKFCANCGAAAAPRPARTRTADTVQPETAAPAAPVRTAPVRAPQSTAEAFHAPLPATSTNASGVNQPELAFSASPRQAAPAAAPPVTPPAPHAPLSRQQEQQVLLEAEEIASVRGMLPIDALPEEFSPAAPEAAPRAARTQTCASCGETNPATNRFCERCGRALQATPSVQSAPAATPQPAPAPVPITQSGWLDVPEPPTSAVAAPAKAAPVAKAVTTPVASAEGKDKDFFYFYDDSSSQRSNRKLIIVLMVVLALGLLGVIYLLSRSGAKSAPAPNVSIAISPAEAQVSVGGAHDFSATVTGSGDTDVLWSVVEGSAGGTIVSRGAQAQGGTVASLGVYVAPTTPGTYHIVATSKANTTKSASAEVLVSGK